MENDSMYSTWMTENKKDSIRNRTKEQRETIINEKQGEKQVGRALGVQSILRDAAIPAVALRRSSLMHIAEALAACLPLLQPTTARARRSADRSSRAFLYRVVHIMLMGVSTAKKGVVGAQLMRAEGVSNPESPKPRPRRRLIDDGRFEMFNQLRTRRHTAHTHENTPLFWGAHTMRACGQF